MWLLWAALSLAQEPVTGAPPTTDAPAAPPDMATSPTTDPCAESLDAAIEAVRASGSKAAYYCLADRDDAGAVLLLSIQRGGSNQERATRALAVHLMQHLDRELTGEELRALNPADLRLLRDAVYARRGRASPAAEHVAVFQQFDWYKPDPKYTNGRLTAQDRANLALIDHPPAAPPVEPAMAAMPTSAPANLGTNNGACGCASQGGGASVWAGLLAALLSLRVARRGRAGTGRGARPRAG